mgnify:CR=1 FL=1
MALPRPQLKGLHHKVFTRMWLGSAVVGASSAGLWYYYQFHIRNRTKISDFSQFKWDCIAKVAFAKPRYDDEWENAVKSVFGTQKNQNLGLHPYSRLSNDFEQSYFDKYDFPMKYKYKGLDEKMRGSLEKYFPWLFIE